MESPPPLTVSITPTSRPLMMTMTQKQWRRQASLPAEDDVPAAARDSRSSKTTTVPAGVEEEEEERRKVEEEEDEEGETNCYFKKFHEQHALKTLLAFTDDHLGKKRRHVLKRRERF